MERILITGLTGHLGIATIEHMLKNTTADKIVALVRSVEKATSLIEKGVEVRIGNFDDNNSLANALKGIDKVLLISGTDPHRLQQHKNVVDASKKAGVKHIIYTGIAIKDVNTSLNIPLMEDNFKTEDYIKENGLTFTFLRNSLYSDTISMHIGEVAIETGIFLPAGTGKVPFVLRRDLAEATANVLLQNGHENKTYELTGGKQYSFEDIASILSKLSGKTVDYTDINELAYSEALKQNGVPERFVTLLSGYVADIKNRQFEIVSNDLEDLLGRKPTDFKAVLNAFVNYKN
ncbi:SDR family oxidoreductase [Maribellus maritimus]|uniref:SDR family oxidoreductase n=1 Tax=Maribellus maritimus TaxID=2870838 RepID=UPI001EEB6C26|nr:SDR family oxidoreductase [Maribellus maritimus]MCG6191147.1 SDR family oxidoreductase [Maribellus maritimus]